METPGGNQGKQFESKPEGWMDLNERTQDVAEEANHIMDAKWRDPEATYTEEQQVERVQDVHDSIDMAEALHDHPSLRTGDRALRQHTASKVLPEAGLEHRYPRDKITGLGNADAFSEAEKEMRETPETSVGVFDANRFKGVNDTYGHFAGDMALRLIGASISRAIQTLGSDARAFRLGGDEFTIIGPTGEVETIIKEAERDFAEQLAIPQSLVAPETGPVMTTSGEPLTTTMLQKVGLGITGVAGPNFVAADVKLNAAKEAAKYGTHPIASKIRRALDRKKR